MAVLINTSKNFFNYRHMSNLQAMNVLLINAGLPQENIIVIQREDAHEDMRNPIKGKVYFTSKETIPHKKFPSIQLDEQVILNIFYLRWKGLLELSSEDTVIFYMCGHGRDEFFKVCDRYFIFKNDLMNAIQALSKRLKRAIVILDTCKAASLVDSSKLEENICVITTSLENEFSYSTLIANAIGVSSIDDFVYKIYKRGIDKSINVKDYFEGLNGNSLKSTVKCWGQGAFRLSDIFSKEEGRENPVRKFIL
ncbi:hypothetical protein GINT2_001196 [Glugoides intestinalis]